MSNQTRTLSQKRAAKKDRNAIHRAQNHGITDRDVINKMADMHSKPNSAQAVSEAAGAILHTRANMRRECPVHDAVAALIEEQCTVPNGELKSL
jgi:hypothetical protein